MKLLLKELAAYLDSEIPLSFQESYDNSGLQVGSPDDEKSSALLTLDVTEAVIREAAASGCDVIISHHPLIFGGLKSIGGKTATERIISEAIKRNIAVYSAHTNLDAFDGGVSMRLAGELGLKDVRVLSPLKNRLLKLVAFVPESHLDNVRNAVFEAGAGVIGNYDRCGFTLKGTGSFRGGEDTNPFSGKKGSESFVNELRFETILFSHNISRVVKALLASHPYEEVAYDLYPLVNANIRAGMGAIGITDADYDEIEFLNAVAEKLGAAGVRYSQLTGKKVRKVALCGGSGSFLLGEAIAAGADAFITGDIKYHTFAEAENKILIVDAGHYETEKFATGIIYDLIIKKFPKFAVRFSGTNTNPINYL
jgi:dinuclear metal center YbgI/SA1388 family protein